MAIMAIMAIIVLFNSFYILYFNIYIYKRINNFMAITYIIPIWLNKILFSVEVKKWRKLSYQFSY